MEKIIKILREKRKTISTMESCTGGGVANAITNVENSSEVFRFGAVTYSNEFKIKMGVCEDVIGKYSVYSMETAEEMSKKISEFTGSDYGIGVTGKLNTPDKNNEFSEDNVVYISIFDSTNDTFYNKKIFVDQKGRKENKNFVIDEIKSILMEIL